MSRQLSAAGRSLNIGKDGEWGASWLRRSILSGFDQVSLGNDAEWKHARRSWRPTRDGAESARPQMNICPFPSVVSTFAAAVRGVGGGGDGALSASVR